METSTRPSKGEERPAVGHRGWGRGEWEQHSRHTRSGAVWARPKVPGDRRPHPKEGPHLGTPPPPAPQTQAQTPRRAH